MKYRHVSHWILVFTDGGTTAVYDSGREEQTLWLVCISLNDPH